MNTNTFILKDVILQYASLGQPATKGEYASNKYEVRVLMTKDQVKMLKGFGLSRLVTFREEENGLYSTNLRSNRKPRVVLRSTRADMSQEQVDKIGNGSTANVKGIVYSTPKGNFLGLEAVAVINYLEYSEKLDDDLFDGEDSIPPFNTDDDDDLLDD